MSDEQPRKKPRLTGPEDIIEVPVTEPLSTTQEAPEAQDPVQAQLSQEKNAGITVFASQAEGFGGLVKKRYTDFLVNEISTDGRVFHLDELSGPAVEIIKSKSGKEEKKEVKNDVKEKVEVKAEEKNGAQNGDKDEAKKEENAEGDTEARKAAAIAAIAPQDITTLPSLFGEQTTTDLCALYGKAMARPDRKAREYGNMVSGVIEDKQQRTDAHINVRRIFNGRIETVTGDDNTIMIKVAPAPSKQPNARALPQNKGKGARPKGKVGWDELGGEHLHFTLYKENKDTMEVLYFIASQMKLAVKNFQFAGTKDRRGVTVQRVSAYRVAADRLQALNPRLKQSRLGGFKYETQGLELGDLYGNEFVITLRDCTFPDSTGDINVQLEHAKHIVGEAMSGFQSRGFINYYGLQRFGTFAISTDTIGKKMLRGDLEDAVNDILAYTPEALSADPSLKISSDDIARATALHLWKTTKKVGSALDALPRRFQAENAIIRHLGWTDRATGQQVRSRDWQGALMNIPRNLRLMYVHAYQSLVWNTVAGERYSRFGKEVVAGDLVLVHEHADKVVAAEEEETIDDCGEVIIRPAADDSATSLSDKFERARPLTEQEVQSGKYNIFDVVLPLPGFDVLYPSNEIGEFYTKFMASERGGGLNPKDMRRKWKDVSLSGGYRKLMARPKGLHWEAKVYEKDEDKLVQTDLDRLVEKAKVEGKEEEGLDMDSLLGAEKKNDVDVEGDAAAAEKDVDVEMKEEDEKEKEKKEKLAVVVRMQLGSSQYATMALRELTKGGAVAFRPDFQGPR